jgi:Flp pilus assembly protein TadG
MLVLTVMVGVAITAATVLALIPVSRGLIDQQRAQAAADAAALAGVTGGRSASERLAAANGATIVSWSRDGHRVTVTVTVGDRRGTARASDEP